MNYNVVTGKSRRKVGGWSHRVALPLTWKVLFIKNTTISQIKYSPLNTIQPSSHKTFNKGIPHSKLNTKLGKKDFFPSTIFAESKPSDSGDWLLIWTIL